MKARVKATGEILEVQAISDYLNAQGQLVVEYKDNDGIIYTSFELDFGLEENTRIPDYWTRLEHQAAIAAMQGQLPEGLCSNRSYISYGNIIELATDIAHALVEKYKGSV